MSVDPGPVGVAPLLIEGGAIELRAIRPWLDELVSNAAVPGAGVNESLVSRMELALHELCINVLTHGYSDLAPSTAVVGGEHVVPYCLVAGERVQGGFRFEVLDDGREFDPASVAEPDPDEPQVGGYGLMIVRQLCDDFTLVRSDGVNRWVLEFGDGGDSS